MRNARNRQRVVNVHVVRERNETSSCSCSDPVSRAEIKTEDAALPGDLMIQLIKTEDDYVEGGGSLDVTSDAPANLENRVDDDGDEAFMFVS